MIQLMHPNEQQKLHTKSACLPACLDYAEEQGKLFVVSNKGEVQTGMVMLG